MNFISFYVLFLSPALTTSEVRNTPDAVILSDEASWTLHADGRIVEERHRRVKIHSDRAYRRHADPRIAFWEDAEEVEILAARVTQANGTVVETPDYGKNLVSPGGFSGWPAYSQAREWVISMSGLEPGAVAELHWRKTTKPGTKPWMWADLRLQDDDPIESCSVTVSVPKSVGLRFAATGVRADQAKPEQRDEGQSRVFRWSLQNLPADPDEPLAPAWRERCARVAFTTCPDDRGFVSAVLARAGKAAASSDGFKDALAAATKEALDDESRVRAIQKLVAGTFTVLDDVETLDRPLERAPERVFDSSYGNSLEAGNLLVELLRAAGYDAAPALLVRESGWRSDVPVPSAIVAAVAEVLLPSGKMWLHPTRGRVTPRSFSDHLILCAAGPQPGTEVPVVPLGDGGSQKDASEIAVQGRLKVDTEGNVTGEIKVRASGRSFNPEQLRTTDEQKGWFNALAGRVIEGLAVETFSVTALSDQELSGTAQIKTSKALPKVGKLHRLALGSEYPFNAVLPLPLGNAGRRLPVETQAGVREQIELRIELSEPLEAVATPSEIERTWGDAGQLSLKVRQESAPDAESKSRWLTVHRTIRIAGPVLAPADFVTLRDGLNELRAEAARTLLFGEPKSLSEAR